MALIKCPECGKEISDKAEACIHCGYPIREIQSEGQFSIQSEPEKDSTSNKKNHSSQISEPIRKMHEIIDRSNFGKTMTLDEYFRSLFECACLEAENVGETYYYRYPLAIFAAMDIILSNRKGYDKYASKDWMSSHIQYCMERLKTSSTSIVEKYEDYRYNDLALRQEVFDLADNEKEGSYSLKLSMFEPYVWDIYEVSYPWFYSSIIRSDTADEAAKMDAENYTFSFEMTLSNLYDFFMSIDLINDYKRPERPTKKGYELPEDIEDIVQGLWDKAWKEDHQTAKTKKIIFVTISAAATIFGFYINNKAVYIIGIIAVVLFGFLYEFFNSRNYEEVIKQQGDVYKRYYEYKKDLKEYEEKYPYPESDDKIHTFSNSDVPLSYGFDFYFGRDNVKQNYPLALKYFRIANELGNSRAKYYLGNAYLQEFEKYGIKQDVKLGLKLLEESGEGDAYNDLGCYYSKGKNRDDKKANHYFQLAADNGSRVGDYNLGLAYLNGDDAFEKDIRQSIRHFEAAANEGMIEAMLKLGDIYKAEPEVENINKSIEWYKSAADMGDSDGQFSLAICYYDRDKEGDLLKSYYWAKKAAEESDDDSSIQEFITMIESEIKDGIKSSDT